MTRAWIHRHCTPRGGWKRKALDIIGVSWPPPKGWLSRAEGLMITQAQRRQFEAMGQQHTAKQTPMPFAAELREMDEQYRHHIGGDR